MPSREQTGVGVVRCGIWTRVEIETSIEANKTLKDSMTSWLQVFKFPSVERTTYDRYECTIENQIYPLIGNKIVGNITAADIKKAAAP